MSLHDEGPEITECTEAFDKSAKISKSMSDNQCEDDDVEGLLSVRSKDAFPSSATIGKSNSFQYLFQPITMKMYNSPRSKPPSLDSASAKRLTHVSTCTCPSCLKYNKRTKNKVSRVYYNASIRLVQAVLERSSVYYTPNKQIANVIWSSQIFKCSFYKSLEKHQRVNQFPCSFECTRKDNLSKNISIMALRHKKTHFNFLPKGFILPKEATALKKEWESDKSHPPWIIKPATSACGRGIYIANHYDEFPTDGLDEFVVEKYLNNPLLLNGFKFDLRLYVAITSFDPLKIYLHDEGLVRLATEKYEPFSPRNRENQFMHLTNYSINKHNCNYRVEESDHNVFSNNKWTLPTLFEYLRNRSIDPAAIFSKIEDLIIKTFISIEDKVYSACQNYVPHRNNCFELFGFDVLVDDTLHPWLLEVNFSPSLACDSDLDLKVKSKVLSDLFNLTNIRPKNTPASKSKIKSKSSQHKVSCSALEELTGKKLSAYQQRILKEASDEKSRGGSFRRIFPREDSYQYKAFFEKKRLNTMLLVDESFSSVSYPGCRMDNIELEQKRVGRLFSKNS